MTLLLILLNALSGLFIYSKQTTVLQLRPFSLGNKNPLLLDEIKDNWYLLYITILSILDHKINYN